MRRRLLRDRVAIRVGSGAGGRIGRGGRGFLAGVGAIFRPGVLALVLAGLAGGCPTAGMHLPSGDFTVSAAPGVAPDTLTVYSILEEHHLVRGGDRWFMAGHRSNEVTVLRAR